MIDPDPISLLRGAPNEALALQFIEYCMTRDAQALWQFSTSDDAEDNLGPVSWELRRMPVRREMYEKYMDRMIDKVNPYETARPATFPDRNMRSFIAPLFSAMAMDHHEELIEAWRAIIGHPAYPETAEIVSAEDVVDPELHDMLVAFDAMPTFFTIDQQQKSLDTPELRSELKYGWLRDEWIDEGLWHPEDRGNAALRRVAASFFKSEYESVINVAK